MRLRDLMLEGNFSLARRMTTKKHPKKLILKIFDNVYKFDYSKPVLLDNNSILRRIEYTQVKITPKGKNMQNLVNTRKVNRINLD